MMLEDALARWERYSFTHALRAVDAERIASERRDAPDGPLRGLLFSVKDLFPVADMESCAGSLLLRGWVPDKDSELTAALRAAGATVFGKGVCAEFGFGLDTENRLDGRVLHFADPSISPGGSSGGDAVAVGAGIVDFALGGDYGGSVRWPAQAAGILGLRFGTAHPLASVIAAGRIGLRPPSQQAELETAGIMARSAGTLRTVLAALADAAGEGEARDRSVPPVFSRPLRVLVSDGTEVAPVLPAVAAAVATARAAATSAGHDLLPAPDGLRDALRDAFAVYTALRAATDDHQAVRRLAAGREELLCGSTMAVLQHAERTVAQADPASVSRLRWRAASIRAAIRAELAAASADALLMPLAASGPIGFGAQVPLMAHCRAVSLTGLPALSVPVGHGLSVQLVGGDGGEDALSSLAGDLMAAA
jgi:amidase